MVEDPLLDLSTVYLEIKLKIEEQEDAFANYETSVRNKKNNKRKQYYRKLNKINRDILSLVKEAEKLESKIIKKNGKSRKTKMFELYLRDVYNKLQMDRKKINELERKFITVEATNESIESETEDVTQKFVFICVLMVIVVIMTVRAFLFEPNTIDTIFLVAALFLTLNHVFSN